MFKAVAKLTVQRGDTVRDIQLGVVCPHFSYKEQYYECLVSINQHNQSGKKNVLCSVILESLPPFHPEHRLYKKFIGNMIVKRQNEEQMHESREKSRI